MTRAAPSVLEVAMARSPRMVGRRVADEFILVPIVSRGAEIDSIFNLSRVGAFIWEHLDGQTTGAGIVAALVRHFDVDETEAQRDYCEFVAQLLSIQAISPAAPDPGR